MKLFTTTSTLLVALSTVAAASDGFVQVDVKKVAHSNSSYVYQKLSKIYGEKVAQNIPLKYTENFYFAQVGVGSNNQEQSLLLDTGSSDFWVQTTLNGLCPQYNCEQFGVFDESKSSSFTNNHTDFFIAYGNGNQYASGLWGQDTANIGSGITVKKANLAFANYSNIEWGLLGLSYAGLESTVEFSGNTYDNFPIQLKQQGYTKKAAYSLYLTDDDTSNILFGGVDKAKYTGDVTTIDVIEGQQGYDFITVRLDSVSVHINGQSSSASPVQVPDGLNVILDSGTPYLVLPGNTPNEILSQIDSNANYNQEAGEYEVDCSLNSSDNYISFSFKGSNLPLNIPFTEFIYESNNACIYSISSGGNSIGILGSPFLRHTYTTFDLDDNTVGLSKVKYTSDSNIVSIQ